MNATRWLAAGVMVGLASIAAPARAASKSVNMTASAYDPPTVTVAVNDDVFWCNPSNQDHDVHADDGSFIKAFPANSGCSGRTFQQAGSFPYHCTIVSGMSGTVVVGGGGTTAPTTTASRPATTSTTTHRTTVATTATTTKRVTSAGGASPATTTTTTGELLDTTPSSTDATSSTTGGFAINTVEPPSSGPPLAAPLVGAVTLVAVGYLVHRWRLARRL